jgi:tetratricopeptide (TPR) repeat protein
MAEAMRSGSGVDIDKLEADFQADPGNFVPLARAYLERKLAHQAVRACKRGLKSNPNAPSGLLALGMAYYQAYDDQNAEAVLKKVLRGSPETAVAHRTLGEIFLDRGQDQKAIAELMRALEIEPGDRHTRALLESLEEKLPALKGPDGQPKDYWLPRQHPIVQDPPKPLWHTLGQILAVAIVVIGVVFWYRHVVDIRVKVDGHVKKALTAIPRDNFDDLIEAEKELMAAYALDDSEEKVIVRLSSVRSNLWLNHAQADRMEQLKKHLAWMEGEELPNPERFALKALMMIHENKTEEAEKFLTEIIERAIKKKDIFLDASVFGMRGKARLLRGNIKEGREDYSRAARFSGDSPHYQGEFADVYLREGNLPRAIKYFKDAKRANPAHAVSNLRQAYAYIQLGKDFEQAKKVLDEYLDPERHPDAEFSPPVNGLRYLVQAELALATNNVPDANTWLRKSLAAYDNSAEAHNLAGRLAALNKDAAKANAEFAKALQIDPHLPKVYFDRAESLFQLGEKSQAIEKIREFERALQPTVAYHVKAGDLYLRMDDLQAAMNEFQKAVKVDELSPDARFNVARCYQAMGAKLGDDKDKKEQKLAFYNDARQWYEDTIMLPGGERGDVYHMMGRIYLDSEDPNNALDKLAKAAMMMQKAREPGTKVAFVYDDIARVFKYLGGPEGEKQEQIYLFKAKGLREGKTLEEVEKEALEQAKKEKPKSKKRKRRRRRR